MRKASGCSGSIAGANGMPLMIPKLFYDMKFIIWLYADKSSTFKAVFMVADFSFSVLRLCKYSTRSLVLLVFIPAAKPRSKAIFRGFL